MFTALEIINAPAKSSNDGMAIQRGTPQIIIVMAPQIPTHANMDKQRLASSIFFFVSGCISKQPRPLLF